MIDKKQWAIVRAALRFFDEEMGPHGSSFKSYLNADEQRLSIGNDDLSSTRELFESLVLRQAWLDFESGHLTDKQDAAFEDSERSEKVRQVTLVLPSDIDLA